MRSGKTSSLLTVRVDDELTRSLDREAERRRTSRSELVREILAEGLAGRRSGFDLELEARRQSLLVCERDSEREALEFVEAAADTRGWS
jgi:metal-responsive CopG/Arc/MetJ family transcriptional regulator